MWFIFGPTLLWLSLFLAWSGFCIAIGYKARGENEITEFIEKHRIRREPPDDPPVKERV